MSNTEFVYTTYIKTTPEKVWAAITNPEFSRQYWVHGITSDWKVGSKWEHVIEGGNPGASIHGEVLESVPPHRLVISWADVAERANTEHSRVTFEIERIEDLVRLNVIHDKLKAGSITAGKISTGWPRVLSSLKSLLETGSALDTWAGQQAADGCSGGNQQ